MSAKPQHTPGPWEVRPSSNPANGFEWRDIVSVGTEFKPSYVGEALEQDASLIAAAPELLAALRQTLDALYNESHGDRSPWIESVIAEANAAIAKANGEDHP